MDCNQAYFHLQLRGRGHSEGGADEFAELDRHVASCPGCSRVARSLAAEDAALARAITAVPVPEGLRDRLLRDHRDRNRTQRRKTAYRLLAAAASIFLCVGLALGFTAATRPRLDLEDFVLKQDSELENQDAAAQQWRAEHRLPELRLHFNMALLSFMGTQRIQGRDVPVLVFEDPRDPHTRRTARVYFFRDDQFTGLEHLPNAMASRFQARVFREKGISIVVLFTGQNENDLKPFLMTHNQT